HPCRMERRREQLDQVGLALACAARTAGEGEQTYRAAFRIMDAVHQELGGAEALDLALEAARADLGGGAEVEHHRLIAALLPGLEEGRRDGGVAQEQVAEEVRLRRGHREAVGAECR